MKYKVLSGLVSVLLLFGLFLLIGHSKIIKANEDYKRLKSDVQKEHYVSELDDVRVELVNLKSIDYNEKVGQCSRISTFSGFSKYIECIENTDLCNKLKEKYNRDFFNSGKKVTVLCTGYEDTEINKVGSVEKDESTWTIVKEIGNVGVNIKDKNVNTVMYIMEHKDNEDIPMEYNITYKTSDTSNFTDRLKKIKISEQFWSLGERLPYKEIKEG